MAGAGAQPFIDAKIKQRPVLMFTKKQSPECHAAKQIMDQYKMKPTQYEVVEIESRQDCTQIENYFQIICQTDTRSVPQLFIGGKYIGGEKEIPRLQDSGRLKELLQEIGAV